MKIKMEDIARICGVSRATVSYVLNQKPNSRVSEKTARRILEVAKKLGYERRKRYKVLPLKEFKIALIISRMEEYSESNQLFVFSELVKGINEGFYNSGYQLKTELFSFDILGEEECVKMIEKFQPDGIVYFEARNALHLVPKLKGIPYLVLYDPEAIGKSLNYLTVDDEKSAMLGVEFLINQGHTRIAFFSFNHNSYCMKKRFEGYKKTLRKHNLPYDEKLVIWCSKNQLEEGVEKILKNSPTAIFTTSDIVATLIMKILKRKGVSVPDDISIMGFSNLPLASHTIPPLTTVDKPRYEIGWESAMILHKWDNYRKLIQKKWKSKVIVRGSTKEIKEKEVRKNEKERIYIN